jgi:hypothetical protein
MVQRNMSEEELGWNPYSAVKKAVQAVGSATKTAARAVGGGISTAARATGSGIRSGVGAIGSGTKRALQFAAKGACKVITNPTVQRANHMASSAPHPAAAGLSIIGSLCSPGNDEAKNAAAAAAAADPALQAALMAAISPPAKNWTPWIIGGAVGAAALVGGAVVLTRRD